MIKYPVGISWSVKSNFNVNWVFELIFKEAAFVIPTYIFSLAAKLFVPFILAKPLVRIQREISMGLVEEGVVK